MSTKHVTLIGQDSGQERQIVTVDRFNNALVVQTEVHENVHRGIFYTVSGTQSIGSDSVADFLIRVTTSSHIRFTGTVEHTMLGQLWEAPTTSADGTPLLVSNRNRFSANTAGTLFFGAPTVTDPGTQLMDFLMAGGNKNTASGGSGSSFEEWILAPGDYIARVSNTILSPAAAGYAGVVMDFYEPGQSPDIP